jgi:hypothetical protein
MVHSVTSKSRQSPKQTDLSPLLSTTDELAKSDQAFEVQLARSSLEYLNGTWGVGQYRDDPERALCWVSEIIGLRHNQAKGLGGVPRKAVWESSDRFSAQFTFNWAKPFLFGTHASTGRGPGFETMFSWINEMLRDVPIHQVWQVQADGALRTVTIPFLDSPLKCVAFAIGCIAGNRWEMRGRVRLCPFIPRGETGRHLFLDYRTGADGAFLPGKAREYCSEQHSNAQRQRDFKRGNKVKRKHK